MTILPKKTSQRPPGGGGGATAEGSQEHPQGGHFNISSQVRKGRVYENECLKLDVENFTAMTPHPMCWDFFKRVVVFSMSCAKRDPPLELIFIILQAAEAHERLFVSAGGRIH